MAQVQPIVLEPLQNTHVLSGQSFALLKHMMIEHKVAAGTWIFNEEEKAAHLYYIKRGQIKLSKTTEDGKELFLSLFQEGDLFGELGRFGELTHSYNACTTQDSLIGMIHLRDLEGLLCQNGALAVEMMKWMELMHRITQMKIRDLVVYGKSGAICSTLIRMANSYGEYHPKGILITKKMSNTELGGFISATRESVNRMLRNLEKNGALEQERGYIIIKDIDYLKNICHCEHCPLEICRM